MAPRVLEAERGSAPLRLALEDSWLNERVQRRWQHFVLSLGEAATERLLEQASSARLAGVRTMSHAPGLATAGWALARGGRVAAVPRARCTALPRADTAAPVVRAFC
jgi:hypothetical protein